MRISKQLIEYRKAETRKWDKIDKIMNKTQFLVYVSLTVLIILVILSR